MTCHVAGCSDTNTIPVELQMRDAATGHRVTQNIWLCQRHRAESQNGKLKFEFRVEEANAYEYRALDQS
jgi:hypothetical protein